MSVVSKGLEGIVAAETRLGEVMGAEGVLFYCGYDINELVKVSYEEVVHLLYYNKLPNRAELEKLTAALRAERELPQGVIDFLKHAPKDAKPIDIMRTAVSMLGCYDQKRHDIDVSENLANAIRLTSQIGVIAAYFHRARLGLELLPVRKDRP
jgi:citrate synthase